MVWNDVPWSAWMPPWSRPTSCCGKNPFGMTVTRYTLRPIVSRVTASVTAEWRSTNERLASYRRSIQAKTRSLAR